MMDPAIRKEIEYWVNELNQLNTDIVHLQPARIKAADIDALFVRAEKLEMDMRHMLFQDDLAQARECAAQYRSSYIANHAASKK